MTTIVKRLTKGSTLTVTELDANVNNLNTNKLETANGVMSGIPTVPDQNIDIISPVYPTAKPSLNIDFTKGKLDPRITFVRASSGTYYDGETTVKAEENLLKNSNLFTATPWVNSNCTLTANVTDPLGTTNAFSLSANTNNAVLYQSTPLIGTGDVPNVFSIYIQRVTGTGNVDLTIDGTTYVTQTITGSWARYNTIITLPYNQSGQRNVGIRLAVAADAVNIAYAQVEQRAVVTSYIPTTTTSITNWIPVLLKANTNVPRFNYDPITGKSLGLLIEEARTNLITNSSELSSWNQGGASVLTSNTIIAPDGTLSGDQLYTNGTNRTKFIVAIAGQIYAFSIYAKKDTSSSFGLEFAGGGSGGVVNFNFDTLAVNGNSNWFSNMTYTSVGNGWYRVSVLITATVTSTSTLCLYGAGGYGLAGSTFFWGAQLELVSTLAVRTNTIVTGGTNTSIILDSGASATANVYAGNRLVIGTESQIIATYDAPTKTANVSVAFSFVPTSANTYTIIPATMTPVGFATSYIPTVSGTVGRGIDAMSMTGTNFSSWYNHTEWTIYTESNSPTNSVSTIIYYLWLSTYGGIGSSFNNQASGSIRFQLNGSSTTNINTGTAISGLTNKYCATAKLTGSNVLVANGTVLGSIPSQAWRYVANELYFYDKNSGGSSNSLNGHIKKFVFYPKSLTSTEMQALTS